ncbi:MAG: hypothetical protein AAGF78_09685 [Pseudomonadota bacterium]
MSYLQAALAFAVLMIVFSTAATALCEAYLRLFARRPATLSGALVQFIKHDPRLRTALEKVFKNKEAKFDTRRRFGLFLGYLANLLGYLPRVKKGLGEFDYKNATVDLDVKKDAIVNRIVAQLVSNPASNPDPLRIKPAKSVDTLTTYAFVQRLAETDLGRNLSATLEKETLMALVRGFERLNSSANELFRKRARSMTMVAAVVLAFAINIPADKVFQHLMDNPEVARDISAQGEEAFSEYEARVATLEARFDDLQTGVQREAGDTEVPLASDEALEAIRADFDAFGEALDIARDDAFGVYDLPIGYDNWYAYNCVAPGEDAPVSATRDQIKACIGSTATVLWVLNVLLAGLLIGLGGPFWYRIYASLSHAAQLLRVFKGNPRPENLGEGNAITQPVAQAELFGHGEEPGKQLDDTIYEMFLAAAKEPAAISAEDTPPEEEQPK